MRKKVIVVHSGGMDSSLCLATALREHGGEAVLSLSFRYGQRHSRELEAARVICREWGVDHAELPLDCLSSITKNALTDPSLSFGWSENGEPSTLVEGRNGLMARLAAIHVKHLGGDTLYMGVMELEEANSGYRDCSRRFMDMMEQVLRYDLNLPEFSIRTPLVRLTKGQTMEYAHELGVLEFLLEHSVTCYEGLSHWGCGRCPACLLRNEGIRRFCEAHPTFTLPF